MRIVAKVITAAAMVLIQAVACLAATGTDQEGIRITADTMSHDQERDLFTATANVKATWEGMNLTCDRVEYDRKNQRLIAEGNVRMDKGGDSLQGERAVFDMETGRGELEKGRIFVQQKSLAISGERICRTSDSNYSIEQGTFTTCEGSGTPAWNFSSSSLEVTLDEYASGWNTIFYVKGVPAFYFPYLLFPVKKDRQSGFLIPHIGVSKSRGLQIELPYYWAISPNQEATITLDAMEKRGLLSSMIIYCSEKDIKNIDEELNYQMSSKSGKKTSF